MRAVRRKNTDIELKTQMALHALGVPVELHPQVPGSPDMTLPKHKVAVWVHGCFWHGHECKKGQSGLRIGSGSWFEKINRTIRRDKLNLGRATEAGWKVHVVWGCEILPGVQELFGQLSDSTNR